MKIRTLEFTEAGPLGDQRFDFIDDWSGDVERRILFSGPNGCGKSTVLRAVAMLWEAAGYWLDHRKTLPRSHPVREWLQRWGGIAMTLHGAGPPEAADQPVGVIFGDAAWCQARMTETPDVLWLGEAWPAPASPATRNGSFTCPGPTGSRIGPWRGGG